MIELYTYDGSSPDQFIAIFKVACENANLCFENSNEYVKLITTKKVSTRNAFAITDAHYFPEETIKDRNKIEKLKNQYKELFFSGTVVPSTILFRMINSIYGKPYTYSISIDMIYSIDITTSNYFMINGFPFRKNYIINIETERDKEEILMEYGNG